MFRRERERGIGDGRDERGKRLIVRKYGANRHALMFAYMQTHIHTYMFIVYMKYLYICIMRDRRTDRQTDRHDRQRQTDSGEADIETKENLLL